MESPVGKLSKFLVLSDVIAHFQYVGFLYRRNKTPCKGFDEMGSKERASVELFVRAIRIDCSRAY